MPCLPPKEPLFTKQRTFFMILHGDARNGNHKKSEMRVNTGKGSAGACFTCED
jgi:hypothetical protein